MSGTISEVRGAFRVVYFSEDLPKAEGICLAAAVVWRVAPPPQRWGLRDLLRQLRLRFGSLGAGFHLRGRFEPWSGSSGPQGEWETLYSPDRRVVRVLGREYALPEDGRTLMLLIDETGGPGGSPRVSVRALRAPTVPYPSIDPLRGGAQLEGTASEEHQVWAAFLQEDPEVRAFMSGSTDHM